VGRLCDQIGRVERKVGEVVRAAPVAGEVPRLGRLDGRAQHVDTLGGAG
jgi:hypothetical protein